MNLTDLPAKFPIPFASSVVSPFIRAVPQAPSGTPGQASLQNGFPPENFSPVAAGGVPPFGADFNGLFNQATAWNRFQAAGVQFPVFDPLFQAACGGYPKTAIVRSRTDIETLYESIVDGNVTDPDAGGAGWVTWLFTRRLFAPVVLYVNPSIGSDNFDGSSATVTSNHGPFATLQKALNVVGQFAPGTYGATINLAAGSYNPGSPNSFQTATWAHCNVSIVGSGLSTILTASGSSPSVLVIAGPNNYTLASFAISSTSTKAGGSACITVSNGAVAILNGSIAFNGFTTAVSASFLTAASSGQAQVYGSLTLSGSVGTSGTNGQFFFANGAGAQITFDNAPAISITSAVTCNAFVSAIGVGQVIASNLNPPTFVNPANVTGSRYSATLNGIVNSNGQGAAFFPGSIAGTTATGGQYG